MTQSAVHGRPGAVLAIGVIAAHLLLIQGLDTHDAPAPGRAMPAGLRVHTLPLDVAPPPARAPESRVIAGGTPTHAAARATNPTTGPVAGPTPPDSAPHAPAPTEPAAGTAAARIAPSMHVRYAVSGRTREQAVAGQAELIWQHAGTRYEATLTQEGAGLARRSQHSAGQLTAQGLVPERYAARARHEEAVHFEHASGRAVFSANRPAAALQAGAQDRLSLLLQLGARIAAQPQAHPPGAHLEIQTATTRDALVWRFRIEGHEELTLPGGHLRTLRLVRLPLGTFEPALEVWLAPALDYAPVRMRLTQPAGDSLDYQWSGTDRR
jgi:hypothetical protein